MIFLAAQIIDQQITGIAATHDDDFTYEFRLGQDEGKKRSAAFLFLVAETMFDLTEDETLEGIVVGGEDYGNGALYFEFPIQEMINISLVQWKNGNGPGRHSAYPEYAKIEMINAIKILFDPSAEISVNERLRRESKKFAPSTS